MHYLTLGNPPKTVGLAVPSTLEQKVLTSVFSAILEEDNRGSVKSDIQYTVRFSDNKYNLFRNNRLTHQNKDEHKIIYALEWQIVSDFLKAYKNYLKFHAAALTFRNEGFLFIGHSGTGKTSLSVMLMQLGWHLLSDEFGILDKNTLTIHPFPRNIIIKPHHPIEQSRRNKFVDTIYRNNTKKIKIHYFPTAEFGAVQLKPVPLKHIYYLKNSISNQFSVEILKKYQALSLLLDHLNNPQLIQKTFLTFISSIFNNIQHSLLCLPDPFSLNEDQQKHLSENILS